MPYRDCKCIFEDMDNTRVKCNYIKLSDVSEAKANMDAAQSNNVLCNIAKHPIKKALLHHNLPLSNLIHGTYRMMPPELLQSSGNGLIVYYKQGGRLLPGRL
jgi:hypothetical protein